MLKEINSMYRISYQPNSASLEDLNLIKREIPTIPDDYLELMAEATRVLIKVKKELVAPLNEDRLPVRKDRIVLGLLNPMGCIEATTYLRSSNGASFRYSEFEVTGDMIPIGDDMGGHTFLFMNYQSKAGLYMVSTAGLGLEEPLWLAPSLRDLLVDRIGLDAFLHRAYRLQMI